MSFTPKDLTTGGQIMSYNLRMFGQVNTWIGSWVFVLFLLMTGLITWLITPYDVMRNGFWYWCAWLNAGFIPLMDGKSTATWDVVWTCGEKTCTTPLTLAQIVSDPWMISMGDTLAQNIRLTAVGSGLFCLLLFTVVVYIVGRSGKDNRSDEILSGMELTENPSEVNRMLRKDGARSDLRIGDLSMVKDAEVMNFLIHGTVGVGKSTLIRWLLDYIRRRGDRAIIFDSGCTFVETHHDERLDVIMNPHDERCPNWDLWRECIEVVDYENLTASLIPEEGESDPFWVSSSRTIFADAAMKMASDPNRSIEKFLTLLLSMGLKDLRDYLRNMPSANLVEEKIEKTAISIRSVVTNYAKSLRYLQGLNRADRAGFSIREWMTEEKYDSSWMFISTTARHRKAVRPVISMWLSLATIHLQSMGENSERRVWFILDEKPRLQKIPEFLDTLSETRKFGGVFVIGIQNESQLFNIYGQHTARAILDLLNTRAYGRSPSAEVAKIVQEELGSQRRREAREQNSFGLDLARDGISISKDKVKEPVVDYEQVMKLHNLNFYIRLPGEYPVVKLALKYRKQKKYHKGLIERDFKDALSPELEQIIKNNEYGSSMKFPTGEYEDAESLAMSKDDPKNTAVKPQSPAAAPVVEPAPGATPEAPKATAAVQEPEAGDPAAVREEAVHRSATVLQLIRGGKTEAAVPQPVSPPVVPEPVKEPAVPEPPQTVAVEPPASDAGADKDGEQTEAAPAAEPVPAAVKADVRKPFTPSTARALPVNPGANQHKRPTALSYLGKRRAPADAQDAENPADADTAAGESPELNMEAERDERGELVLRTAGVRRTSPDEPEKTARDPEQIANRSMAEEEKNILRHHHDYEAYSNMTHDNDGGFER